jgi:hypothetical protein
MRLPRGLREGIGRSIGVAAEALGKHLDEVIAKRPAGGVQYALVLVRLDQWAHWINSGSERSLLKNVVAHWARETATPQALAAATAWIHGDRATIALTIETLRRDDSVAGGLGLIDLQYAFKRAGLLNGTPTHKYVMRKLN